MDHYIEIHFYTTETENLESDEVYPKPIMGGNSERQVEGGGQGEGGEGDRGEEHEQSEGEVEEKPQSQRERDQHRSKGQRVGEEVQKVIIFKKSET